MTVSNITRAVAGADQWHATEPWVKLGNRTVVWLLGGLFLFAAFVSISGAVVATGTVTFESSYKTVQHLDGGIVRKILVKNGDRVDVGDVLVLLEDKEARASLTVSEGRVHDLLIQEARLTAEREGKDSFALPEGLDAADPAVKKIVASQQSLFRARSTSQKGQQSVLTQKVAQLQGEIKANAAEIDSARRQREINTKELESVMPLYEKGFVNQQRLSPLQRESARLDGEMQRLAAEGEKLKSALAETELRVAQGDKEYLSDVAAELQKVEAALAEEDEKRKAIEEKVARTEIRAPTSGRVHALAVHTEGGVITAATPILQIIPDSDRLVVEAQLQPRDIDKVRVGHAARVNFPAFNAKTTPKLNGTVGKVSPAQMTDKDGRSYFTAEIEIGPQELTRLGAEHQLVPGMPAEIFIETHERSILSYFLKPLSDAMSRAFRES